MPPTLAARRATVLLWCPAGTSVLVDHPRPRSIWGSGRFGPNKRARMIEVRPVLGRSELEEFFQLVRGEFPGLVDAGDAPRSSDLAARFPEPSPSGRATSDEQAVGAALAFATTLIQHAAVHRCRRRSKAARHRPTARGEGRDRGTPARRLARRGGNGSSGGFWYRLGYTPSLCCNACLGCVVWLMDCCRASHNRKRGSRRSLTLDSSFRQTSGFVVRPLVSGSSADSSGGN